jgi:hypothetical protein
MSSEKKAELTKGLTRTGGIQPARGNGQEREEHNEIGPHLLMLCFT